MSRERGIFLPDFALGTSRTLDAIHRALVPSSIPSAFNHSWTLTTHTHQRTIGRPRVSKDWEREGELRGGLRRFRKEVAKVGVSGRGGEERRLCRDGLRSPRFTPLRRGHGPHMPRPLVIHNAIDCHCGWNENNPNCHGLIGLHYIGPIRIGLARIGLTRTHMLVDLANSSAPVGLSNAIVNSQRFECKQNLRIQTFGKLFDRQRRDCHGNIRENSPGHFIGSKFLALQFLFLQNICSFNVDIQMAIVLGHLCLSRRHDETSIWFWCLWHLKVLLPPFSRLHTQKKRAPASLVHVFLFHIRASCENL